MDIQTKDGILLRNIPDGTPDDAIKARIADIRASKGQVPQPVKPVPEKGLIDTGIDNLKNVASQAISPDFWKGVGHDLTHFPPIPEKGTPEREAWDKRRLGESTEMALNFLPVSAGPKLAQAAAGPVSKAVGAVGRSIRDAADLVLPGGARRIADRYTDKIVGENGRQAVIDALAKAKPIVPGSNPTAAEAVAHLPEGSPVIAHQKIIAETPGGISAKFGQRTLEQQAARESALKTIAKDEATLAAAESARASNAAKNYQAAYAQQIKADPELIALSKNPYFKDALPDALKLAEAKGINPKENLTQVLHYVKISLDKALRKNGDTALSSTEKEVVHGVKKDLVNWLEKKNPLYDTARKEFEQASKPINQMQVGQALQSKLVNPTGAESPGVFLRALDDSQKLIKTSTGMPRQQIGQVLTPEQQKVAKAVADDLERKLLSQRPAQKTALQGGVNVAEESSAHLPNLLSRPAMLVNYGRRMLGAGIEPKVDAILAERYLNPGVMAKAMEKASPAQKKVLHAMMRKIGDNNIVSRSLIAAQENQ